MTQQMNTILAEIRLLFPNIENIKVTGTITASDREKIHNEWKTDMQNAGLVAVEGENVPALDADKLTLVSPIGIFNFKVKGEKKKPEEVQPETAPPAPLPTTTEAEPDPTPNETSTPAETVPQGDPAPEKK
jgi:hypothetical protein